MDNNQPIIVKRVKRYAAGHHGGSWKIAFADFATAMMAFFLVLWLLSSATPEQKKAISGYFQDPIGFSESASPYVIDLGGTPTPAPDKTLNPQVQAQPDSNESRISPEQDHQVNADQAENLAEQVERERLALLLQELQNKVDENPMLKDFKDQIHFEITRDGLRIQIVDAANRLDVRPRQRAPAAVFRGHPAGHGRDHPPGAEQDQHQRPHRRQALCRQR